MREIKEAVFVVETAPIYVTAECPYCKSMIEFEYKELIGADYPWDWEGEKVNCSNCDEEVIIGSIEWD